MILITLYKTSITFTKRVVKKIAIANVLYNVDYKYKKIIIVDLQVIDTEVK